MREDWQLRFIQLFAVMGLLVAHYLLLFHQGVLIAACTGSGWDDCGAVSGPTAPFASVGPIPVAFIGLIGYAIIFLLTWLKDWEPLREGYFLELLLGMTGLGFLFTVGLTALEAFVIHAFCRYCLISAVFMTIIFILSISFMRAQSSGD
ncbi:MAG: vitamin K epoxide reductase family protein [Chloroflexi bacterium]|nr:vitamin K epoxide reductase family protein [Chloroflexota bacterium]